MKLSKEKLREIVEEVTEAVVDTVLTRYVEAEEETTEPEWPKYYKDVFDDDITYYRVLEDGRCVVLRVWELGNFHSVLCNKNYVRVIEEESTEAEFNEALAKVQSKLSSLME